MHCPNPRCVGTISILTTVDELTQQLTNFYYPCTKCRGVFKENKMPEVRNNVPCPKPGCSGSRADIIITDDDGNWIGQRNESCNVCGS